ncbi:MAG: flagellar basal-body protein FlbY [Hyphomonadaceae bacterium]|nr:flagellar basal-body protein FlbY [Hyphomonadaceae bacterium]
MALIADDAADRAEQLLLLTGRLAALVDAEGAALAQGDPLSGAGAGDELRRLANAYRLEIARIKEDRTLIAAAPRHLRQRLQDETARLQARLETYSAALFAAREITEGLVRAVAEEVQRARNGPAGYGAQGAYAQGGAVAPVALDQRA